MKFVSTEVKEHVLAAIDFVRDGARSTLTMIRDNGLLMAFVLALFAAAIWYAKAMPPLHVVMSAGPPGSSYDLMAKKYMEYFAENGVRLEARPSTGALENLKRLKDPDDASMAAFFQSGIATGCAIKSLHCTLR